MGQVLFLNELEETLELTQPSEFHRMQEPLFSRLALCITCPHFQVAERALFFWNNDYVVKLLMEADPQLFDQCSAQHRTDEEMEESREQSRQQRWKLLHDLHDTKVSGSRP